MQDTYIISRSQCIETLELKVQAINSAKNAVSRRNFSFKQQKGNGRKQQVITEKIAHTQRRCSFSGHLCTVSRRKGKKKGEIEKEKKNLIKVQCSCLYCFYCKCFLINEIVPLPVCKIDLCCSLTLFVWPENFTVCL